MRKIKSKADIEKAKRRNSIILGIVMIFLLVVSSAGYSLMSSDSEGRSNKVSENGFDFVRSDGMWKLAIEDVIFGFQNLPSEVLDVDVNLSVEFGTYSGQPLYFVNPNDGASEILINMNKYILRYQEACLLNYSESCDGDFPFKDCSSNLIIFESGHRSVDPEALGSSARSELGNAGANTGANESRVYSKGNCVFIVGDSIRASDAFLYKILGIN